MKPLLFTILSLSIILISCSEENGFNTDVPSFSKLYYVSDNIEANDFIEKEDGYLILGTYFNINNTQSGMYLINTDNEGFVLDTIRIMSDSLERFERGITLKRHEDDIYVLGVRSNSAFDANSTDFTSIIFKTDLNGNPIKSSNDTSQSDFTLKILENSVDYPMKMNDLIIKDDKIILGGTIYNNNLTGEIIQIYNLNLFNSINPQESLENEFPNTLKVDVTNTSILRVFEGVRNNIKYTTVGQNIFSNDENSIVPASRNIVRKVYTDYNSPASFVPRIYNPREEFLGDAFQESVGGAFYYAGSYGLNGSNQKSNELFLIRDDFNPVVELDNQANSETTNEIGEKFGNTVISITQNSLGNIYIASTEEIEEEDLVESYLFKFSSSGGLLIDEPIEFKSSRFYNIRKIKASEKDDKILILSSLDFENNARAIGLMKIDF